ncbi:hypothetical protein BDZ89DRAFT_962460, partial [Hymenopellis radicata]
HTDQGNLAWSWCAITALGNYNPDKGGHLIVWDLGLIIRFPPGSTIMMPSALLTHSNVEIQQDEERMSVVHFSAGGLFRYVQNGCITDKEFIAEVWPSMTEEGRAVWWSERESRWQNALNKMSTWDDILRRSQSS